MKVILVDDGVRRKVYGIFQQSIFVPLTENFRKDFPF